MLGEAVTDSNVATEQAQEVLKEQVGNLQQASESLHERQAADFGRRTIRNFVSEVLRRAYAPVRTLAKSDPLSHGKVFAKEFIEQLAQAYLLARLPNSSV